MTFSLYDTVVLDSDLPHQGLKAGAVGIVIEVYGPGLLEVDFAEEEATATVFSSQVAKHSTPEAGALAADHHTEDELHRHMQQSLAEIRAGLRITAAESLRQLGVDIAEDDDLDRKVDDC